MVLAACGGDNGTCGVEHEERSVDRALCDIDPEERSIDGALCAIDLELLSIDGALCALDLEERSIDLELLSIDAALCALDPALCALDVEELMFEQELRESAFLLQYTRRTQRGSTVLCYQGDAARRSTPENIRAAMFGSGNGLHASRGCCLIKPGGAASSRPARSLRLRVPPLAAALSSRSFVR